MKFFRYCYHYLLSLFFVLLSSGLIFAAGRDEDKPPPPEPEWILSYALLAGCVTLGLILILRSGRRADSIIDEYDRKRMQEEELKRMGKH